MHRKLTSLFIARACSKTKSDGFTITEVIVASSLLIVAMVPILKVLTTAHANASIIEYRTQSLMLAQGKLNEIKAQSIYNYSDTFTETDSVLDGSYLGNVTDTAVSAELRTIEVAVGFDSDGDSTLDSDEIDVTLTTYLAKRW